MELELANRLSGIRPSPAGDILKVGNDKSIISLAAGNPAPEAFPVDLITKIATEELRNDPISVLQYSTTQGYAPLIEEVEKMLSTRYGIAPDSTLIISGAQQGASLMAQLLCNEGDTVLCEDPSFMGCMDAFRSFGAHTVGIPMDSDGINTDCLEQALKTEKNIRFIYLIPNFQNPTGITMSATRRQRVYELAVRYNVLVLEDNPYGDLRFHGAHIMPIKNLDKTGHVVYMGSFSKILAPGVRVGFICGDDNIIKNLTKLKLWDDVHTNILAQHICHRFLAESDLEQHLLRLAKIYRHKCELMLSEMDKHFNKAVTYTRPDGGLFIWCRLPSGVNSADFCAKAVQNKVLTVPGATFCADNTASSNSFRLNFSTPTDENIVKGIEILGRLTHQI